MSPARSRFLRDNAFLVAAITLPLLVAIFFVVASTIPRWTVPPPSYDLLFRVSRPYQARSSSVSVEFRVREGRVEAVAKPATHPYPEQWDLLLFDHETMHVRDIPVDVPETLPEGESRTIVVEIPAGRRISEDPKAPDGYELSTRSNGGGLVGDIFGMSRSRQRVALVNGGRVVEIVLPRSYDDGYVSVFPVGWAVGDGR